MSVQTSSGGRTASLPGGLSLPSEPKSKKTKRQQREEREQQEEKQEEAPPPQKSSKKMRISLQQILAAQREANNAKLRTYMVLQEQGYSRLQLRLDQRMIFEKGHVLVLVRCNVLA